MNIKKNELWRVKYLFDKYNVEYDIEFFENYDDDYVLEYICEFVSDIDIVLMLNKSTQQERLFLEECFKDINLI